VADKTRNPDSGRAAGAKGSGALSAIFSISISGFEASSSPCGCRRHSSSDRQHGEDHIAFGRRVVEVLGVPFEDRIGDAGALV